jgi:hypothetical protein
MQCGFCDQGECRCAPFVVKVERGYAVMVTNWTLGPFERVSEALACLLATHFIFGRSIDGCLFKSSIALAYGCRMPENDFGRGDHMGAFFTLQDAGIHIQIPSKTFPADEDMFVVDGTEFDV